ncbi:THAP domain containing protein [Plakobranchus ocellatus]|uniref:THAP domain containing protein n=1 Tax=Plakobranchus ocellatus TaxID=259542 RepID=A0AAV4CL21_9GAST|nr:THAP domain containing protein [Plakobranchus ocellatus]
MGKKCAVASCKGNYASQVKKGSRVSIFGFPFGEPERMKKWLRHISRQDFKPTNNVGVCEKHFQEHFIVRYDSVKRDDGSVLTLKRDRTKLTLDAYPSIFPNCPSYSLSETPVNSGKKGKEHKDPEDRETDIEHREAVEC